MADRHRGNGRSPPGVAAPQPHMALRPGSSTTHADRGAALEGRVDPLASSFASKSCLNDAEEGRRMQNLEERSSNVHLIFHPHGTRLSWLSLLCTKAGLCSGPQRRLRGNPHHGCCVLSHSWFWRFMMRLRVLCIQAAQSSVQYYPQAENEILAQLTHEQNINDKKCPTHNQGS